MNQIPFKTHSQQRLLISRTYYELPRFRWNRNNSTVEVKEDRYRIQQFQSQSDH